MAETKRKAINKSESGVDREIDQATDRAGAKKEEVASNAKDSSLSNKDAKPLAKAGKHSAKALKEVAEKEAKEARKLGGHKPDSEKPKPAKKPSRTHLEKAGKKFREAAKFIEKGREYSAKDAVELAIKTSPVKFDATLELHINLGVDPKQADQNVRDTLVLPAGTGKSIRIAVLAEGEDIAAAKKAGADMVGNDDLLKDIEKGVINFDTLIATPVIMPKLGKLARVLGPKGLMPNPKSGTVTADVVKAIAQAKAGRVEYRVDSTGIVHLGAGKVSFGPDKLLQNVEAVFASIKSNKPSSVKGSYVKKITLTTTMGPAIKVAISEL